MTLRIHLLSFFIAAAVWASEDAKQPSKSADTAGPGPGAAAHEPQPANTNEALPARPSEEHIEVLTDKTVTNRVRKLTHAAKAAQYQTALESARKLREG